MPVREVVRPMHGSAIARFLKKLGLYPLRGGGAEVAPGAVLSKEMFHPGFQFERHLSSVLEGPAEPFWETELLSTNLLAEQIETRFTVLARGEMADLGLRLPGIPAGTTVTARIESVHARQFRTGRANKFAILALLHALYRNQVERWEAVRDRWIVTEAYYAGRTTFIVEPWNRLAPRLVVESAGGVRFAGAGAICWIDAFSFRIQENAAPFAFAGFKV